jgi:hypothetical protein
MALRGNGIHPLLQRHFKQMGDSTSTNPSWYDTDTESGNLLPLHYDESIHSMDSALKLRL